MYAHRARTVAGLKNADVDRFVLDALFSTVTNVNFDRKRMVAYLRQAEKIRNEAKALYEKACQQKGIKPESFANTPAAFALAASEDAMLAQCEQVGVLARKAIHGDDIVGLQEMITYGIKGAAAYAEHALIAGLEEEAIYAGIHKTLNKLTDAKPQVGDLLATALAVGELNLTVMATLDKIHTTRFSHPEPTKVSCTPVEGKCILVSGHDLSDLEAVLKATEGKGINVYTHGEMLPAHSYPKLKQYKHLVGHFGGPWQLQRMEFADFPGAILMTSNCIVEPKKSYASRIFTRRSVGWPGVTHIEGNDFSALVASAQKAPGFTKEDVEDFPKVPSLTVGFGRNAVMGVADKVVDAVKSGAIKRFYVIGGCDGVEGERSYFRDLAKSTSKDSVILTLGCGKYRFNSLPLGDIGGIPRVLDVGQCNDAYSAIQIAVALANAFKTDVNSLPLSFAVSWFEQKAVAVLLTLLHLGIKNIRLGPRLPAFCTPNMLNILVEKFNIAPIGKVDEDLAKMAQNK